VGCDPALICVWRFATRGMNSILHVPNQVSVSPAVSRRTQVATPDKYRLEVLYREGTPAIIFNGVHIAPKLLAALQSPDLDSFNMITLRLLSPATWALKNRPTYLLIGVRDRHGGEVSEVPPCVAQSVARQPDSRFDLHPRGAPPRLLATGSDGGGTGGVAHRIGHATPAERP
jgi:hypothetical protein